MAVLLLFIGSLQYVFMRNVIYQSKAVSLESQVKSIPPPAWQQFNSSADNELRTLPRIFIPEASLAFIDVNANYSKLANGFENINSPKLTKTEYLGILRMQDIRHLRYQITDAGGTEQLIVMQAVYSSSGKLMGLVQISTPTTHLKEILLRQVLTFFFLALSALLAGLLAYLPVLKRTLVPLSRMVDAAEQIDAGNLDRRFPVQQGQAEIDRLAESCNGMLERLESSFLAERETQEQMRRFIADASHELRTPLTSIHGFLEVLLRGAANQPEQLEKALKSMFSESQRLNKLVHDLLLLSKLDRSPTIELSQVRLDNLFGDMEAQLRILAGQRKLSFNIEPDVRCNFDSDKIKQVILNLFQNAVQNTDAEKGHIEISLSNEKWGVLFSIKDNGPGISSSHLPHIFDRFYRSDSSRTRKYGGAGLGLAISKTIVEVHGGNISVTSQEGEGCMFQVWLPG
jgi:two-component system OmpR family sensor kinase